MVKIVHYQAIESAPVDMEGAKGVNIRWLISKDDGAKNFAMRLFEIEPGGHTPLHTHEWEHEVFVLEGEGVVWQNENEIPINPGTTIFVAPDEKHCFRNHKNKPLKFICLIPIEPDR